jgi:predicted SPOUT superfamily RNA methylase MTH1
MAQDLDSRQKRKEEGRQQKRQKIEESGGVRPRESKKKDGESSEKTQKDAGGPTSKATESTFAHKSDRRNSSFNKRSNLSGHRFGGVMEAVPCRKKPRFSTLTIALPGSVLSNCQTQELRTLLIGQIARAATIYHVDEIVVFDDNLGRNGNHSAWRRRRDDQKHHSKDDQKNHSKEDEEAKDEKGGSEETPQRRHRSDPQEFMARLLQYCECPQYLRRQFFPMHPDLQFAGLIAPIDAPHHVREGDQSKYREGVVLKLKSNRPGGGSLVNCGIRNRPVEYVEMKFVIMTVCLISTKDLHFVVYRIDRNLALGIRCTVKIDPAAYGKTGPIKGTVVSPSAPREDDGSYWGYTTRMASSINGVFDGCPFEGGYDLKIGTSERGDKTVEEKNFNLPKFEHSLIVFGGVAGIEECVDADESIKLPGSQSKKLFDMW